MTIGVYALIWWDLPERIYIGKSSVSCEKRYTRHIRDMQQGIHHNYKIQNTYNTLQKIPELVILESAKIENLVTLEEQYIKEFNSYNSGLNLTNGGFSGYGPGGITSKFTRLQVLKAFALLIRNNISRKEMSSRSGVSECVINDIKSGRGHLWLLEEFPEKYHIMMNRPKNSSGGRYTLKERGLPTISFKHIDGRIVRNIESISDFVRSHESEFTNFVSAKNNLSAIYRGRGLSYKGWSIYKDDDDR